ncbi:MAG: DivIVA domain-containing protein [Actinobacteria bacterium]|jgi:cell division initiation protein|nr:MAG: DivIVA domain-containing protein [Actinomycetota bacterium]
MGLTPVEIRHLQPAKTLIRGYSRTAVDHLLDEIVVSFEDVWRERADFADKIDQLEADLVRYRELEALLRTTLVSAEKSAVTLKEQAGKEADLIVEEARAEARSITRGARADHDRLLAEVRRMRSLLRAALATVEDDAPTQDAEAA